MTCSKSMRLRILAAAAAASLSLLSPSVHGDDLSWDPGLIGPPGSGGSGTWDTSTVNWIDTTTNSEVPWNNSGQTSGTLDSAVFTTTGGTVSLGVPITARGVNFLVGGYTIDNGANAANTLTLAGGGIVNQSGTTGINTISAQLNLSGAAVNVNSGTFALTNTTAGSANSIDSATAFNVASGATLNFNAMTGADALGAGTVKLNGGTLQITPTANGAPGQFNTKYSAAGYKSNNLWLNDFGNAAVLAGSPTSMSGQNNTSTTPVTTTTGLVFNPTGAGPAFYTGGPITNFLGEFTGAVQIAAGGAYTFQTSSDDSNRLYIDNKLVVADDGGHGMGILTSQPVNLTPGLHEFRVDYIQGGGGFGLIVNYNGADTANTNKVLGSVTPTGGITNGIQTLDTVSMGNNVTLTQDSGINLNGSNFTQVGLGTLTFGQATPAAATLTVSGNAGTSLHLAGTSVMGGSNNTFANTPDVFVGPVSFSGTEAGTTLTAAGPGQLIFNNTITANPMTSASTIAIPTGGRAVVIGSSATGSVNPLGGATLALSGGTLSLDTPISTVANFNTGSTNSRGTLIFNASNTGYSGVVTLNAASANIQGNVNLATDQPFGSNADGLVLHGGTLFMRGGGANTTTYTLPQNITADASFTLDGNQNGAFTNGTFVFQTLTSTATGATTITQNAGNGFNFTFAGPASFAGPMTLAPNADTLTFSSTVNAANVLTINPASGTLNVPGATTVGGNLTVGGTGGAVNLGALTLSGNSNLNVVGGSTLTLNAVPSYTGSTNLTGNNNGGLNGGTLKLGLDNAIPLSSPLTLNAQSIDLNGHNQTINNLTAGGIGTAGTFINNGANPSTLTIGTPLTSLTFNGQFADGSKPLAVAFGGAGQTLTLANQNTFSGGISVGAGNALVAANGTAVGTLGNGTVTLSGGKLLLQGQEQPSSAGLAAGLTGSFYGGNNPASGSNKNPNFNTYAAFNTHLSGQTPTKSVNTTTAGKTNFDYSNTNYGTNAQFGTAGTTTANYGFGNKTNYEAAFTGYINVPAAGWGQFSTNSDDGSTVYIDNQNVPIVNNNAFQGNTNHVGSFYFPQPGLYPITVGYFQGGGGGGLLVQWAPPGSNGGFHTLLNTEVMTGAATLQQLPSALSRNDFGVNH